MITVLCFIVSPALAKKEPPSIDVAGLKVAVWLPKEPAGAPVILFSHGFHGCATQSVFLTEALADAGYAVFAPNHKDAGCYGGTAHLYSSPVTSFFHPELWSDATYADRDADMEKLLETLPADPRFRMLNWRKLGLMGHSLGGYTVLGMTGAWPKWKDKRVLSVLALSPYSQPFAGQHMLSGIAVPVMYQGGTRDYAITPRLKVSGGAYDQTSVPKYFVEFTGAGHFDWTDLFSSYHDDINRYAIAFFDTTLRGKTFPEKLTEVSKGVSTVWIDKPQ